MLSRALTVEIEIYFDIARLEFFQLLQGVGFEGFRFALGGFADFSEQLGALLAALGDPLMVFGQDGFGGG